MFKIWWRNFIIIFVSFEKYSKDLLQLEYCELIVYLPDFPLRLCPLRSPLETWYCSNRTWNSWSDAFKMETHCAFSCFGLSSCCRTSGEEKVLATGKRCRPVAKVWRNRRNQLDSMVVACLEALFDQEWFLYHVLGPQVLLVSAEKAVRHDFATKLARNCHGHLIPRIQMRTN